MSSREVRVHPTPEELASNAAELFASHAAAAQDARGSFRVALSGGSTPKALFKVLAQPPYRDRIDWERVHIFFSDERFVPLDSEESNYHTAYENLLSQVEVPERNVHAVATENVTPTESASLYEQGIRRIFESDENGVPSFDLIFLGLGPDGHTASLFPSTEALGIHDRLVAPNFVPRLDTWRITFTYPLINAARCVAFLIQGEDKAERVRQILQGEGNFPAGDVRPENGQLIWMLDAASARDASV